MGAKFYGVAALPGRVVVVGYPKLVEVPTSMVATWDRGAVSIERWKPGMISGELIISTPDGSVRLEVPRIHRGDAEDFVEALGGAPPA